IFAFGMPAGQALLAATEGAAFGLFPIIWIVLTAIWIFRMTELTGYDLVLRRAFGSLSPDQRVQAIIIAFCFGALLEALAGFGTPVAVTAVMLIAVGIAPMKAAPVALVANTAPVAFGAIAVPITTMGKITGLDPNLLGAMVGRQTPILAVFVPMILVLMVDGRRGVRQAWPAALVGGVAFAGAQFLSSNYFNYQVADIIAALATGALFAFLSPVVGWIGVAVTGSDTSANSLFGLLQTTAATQTGISPYLLAVANTSGGVLGKMISPQNLAIAAAVVGMEHKESALFRKVIWWSLGLLLGMCVLVYLQSTPVLGWMVVG
ncbi:MAG TPA: L-lactate permease, partial [Nakamurella sp.]